MNGGASTATFFAIPAGGSGQCVFCSNSRENVKKMSGTARAQTCNACLNMAYGYKFGEIVGATAGMIFDLWLSNKQRQEQLRLREEERKRLALLAEQERQRQAARVQRMEVLVDGLLGTSMTVALQQAEDLAFGLDLDDWQLFQDVLQTRSRTTQSASLILGRARKSRASL